MEMLYRVETGEGETVASCETFDEALRRLTDRYYDEEGDVPPEPEREHLTVVLVKDGTERTIYDTDAYAANAGVLAIEVAVAACEYDNGDEVEGVGCPGGAWFDWNTDEAAALAKHEENVAFVDSHKHRAACAFIPQVYLELWKGDCPTSVLDTFMWGDLLPEAYTEPTGLADGYKYHSNVAA